MNYSDRRAASDGGDPQDEDRSTFTREIGNELEAVGHVTRCHDAWQKIRYPYEVSWYLDVAYYLGLQWHSWSEVDRSLRESRAPSYRVRLVLNFILPMIRTLMGKLLRGMPDTTVFPIQENDTAFADARIASRMLKAQWKNLNLEESYAEWVMWAAITGSSFMKVGFDPSIGQKVQLPDGSEMAQGEIFCDALSPYAVLVPGDIQNLWKPTRLMETKLIDIEVLRASYPDIHGLQPDATMLKENFYEQRMASLVSPIAQNFSPGQGQAHNAVYVCELWEDPEVLSPKDRAQYPNGRVIVSTYNSKKLLSIHENPYITFTPHASKIPYVMLKDDRIPGRFWGGSRIDQLIPVQKSYNKGRSQMVEARNLTCAPKINVEAGHGIARFTNEPGQVWERTRGTMPPTFMTPPQISQYTVQDIEETKADFDQISQVSKATRGELPSANISGVGINLLQEADNGPIAPFAKNIASSASLVFTKVLERGHQFYDEPRTLAYVGTENQTDVVTWHSDEHPTPLRAEVPVTSVLPEGRAARMARVQETLKMGVLDPVQHREKLLRMLEMGSVDEVWDEADADRQMQMREIRDMMQGKSVPVNPWDGNATHLAQINRLRKSPEWNSLDPQVQQLINQHADAHVDAELKAMSNVTSLPNRMAGAPPGTPTGAPPPGSAPPPAGG